MSEFAKQVEEIATAMQKSYEADIALMARRDKAHLEHIAELTAQRDALRQSLEASEARRDELRQLVYELRQELADARQWTPLEDGLHELDDENALVMHCKTKTLIVSEGMGEAQIIATVTLPDNWQLMRRKLGGQDDAS